MTREDNLSIAKKSVEEVWSPSNKTAAENKAVNSRDTHAVLATVLTSDTVKRLKIMG